MKPPSTAPAIPSSIVTMIPPGSRPGITSFASAPTTKPKRIQPRIVISVCLHLQPRLPVASGRPHGWRTETPQNAVKSGCATEPHPDRSSGGLNVGLGGVGAQDEGIERAPKRGGEEHLGATD